jgi:hypothetical protein
MAAHDHVRHEYKWSAPESARAHDSGPALAALREVSLKLAPSPGASKIASMIPSSIIRFPTLVNLPDSFEVASDRGDLFFLMLFLLKILG